jgi:hypothetical protein
MYAINQFIPHYSTLHMIKIKLKITVGREHDRNMMSKILGNV